MNRRKEEGARSKKAGVRAVVMALAFFLLSPSSFLLTGFFQESRPLPDPDTFYSTTRQNLARAQRVAHLYAFKERRTDVHTNPFGRIGTGGTRLFDVYPSANPQLTYRRLIERNGTPVTAQDLAEQDRRYRARVGQAQQQLARRSPDERRRREEDAAAARRRGQTMIEDVVDTLQFRIEGRAVHDGVQAIVIAFTPKPNASPRTREGRIAQKFAGTVWVDETAAEVMRVEAKAVDDLLFGLGFVARLGEGTTATMTRLPVAGDVWMPTRLTLSGRGRAAVFRRLVVDYAVEWLDYRLMDGNSQLRIPNSQ